MLLTLALAAALTPGVASAAPHHVSDASLTATLHSDVANYLREHAAGSHVTAVLLSVALRGRSENIDLAHAGRLLLRPQRTAVRSAARHDVRTQNLPSARGAGGIVASQESLTKWALALYEGRVLPPQQQREMRTLVSFKRDAESHAPAAVSRAASASASSRARPRPWVRRGSTRAARSAAVISTCIFPVPEPSSPWPSTAVRHPIKSRSWCCPYTRRLELRGAFEVRVGRYA